MDQTAIDRLEEDKVDKFNKDGCGCTLGSNGSGCSLQFSKDEIEAHRMMANEMDKSEKDLVLLSMFHYELDKTDDKLRYRIHGKSVCRSTFLFLFDASPKLFYTLRAHYFENGLVPRVHGNKDMLPVNTH